MTVYLQNLTLHTVNNDTINYFKSQNGSWRGHFISRGTFVITTLVGAVSTVGLFILSFIGNQARNLSYYTLFWTNKQMTVLNQARKLDDYKCCTAISTVISAAGIIDPNYALKLTEKINKIAEKNAVELAGEAEKEFDKFVDGHKKEQMLDAKKEKKTIANEKEYDKSIEEIRSSFKISLGERKFVESMTLTIRENRYETEKYFIRQKKALLEFAKVKVREVPITAKEHTDFVFNKEEAKVDGLLQNYINVTTDLYVKTLMDIAKSAPQPSPINRDQLAKITQDEIRKVFNLLIKNGKSKVDAFKALPDEVEKYINIVRKNVEEASKPHVAPALTAPSQPAAPKSPRSWFNWIVGQS